MKAMMRKPPVSVIFADDDDFTSLFLEDFVPSMPVRSSPSSIQPTSSAGMGWGGDAPHERTQSVGPLAQTNQISEVIDLLDDE
jgi:hypothetical protein